MGLCFYFLAVLEGDADIVCAVDGVKADLLILDELSYLCFNRHQSELLFKVISDRSEKSSTIVTTNLPFSKVDGSV